MPHTPFEEPSVEDVQRGDGSSPKATPGVVLVVTTVHPPDDPRVRDRTVAALAKDRTVRYACRTPGPTQQGDHEWLPLPGGRLRRYFAAGRAALAADVDVVSLHDPELVPVGIAARLLRGRHVIFDVHEDLPGQLRDKEWVPRPLRPALAGMARVLFLVAERFLTLTLAEQGYQRRFHRQHVVLPNYPDVDRLPSPTGEDGGYVVYVGDVREVRGAVTAVEAVARMADPLPLVLIGRCRPPLDAMLRARAAALGVELSLPGFLPHADAMGLVARATAGISPLHDIPNYRWSLPTKVLEYLALGVPVVASKLPGTEDVVGGLPGVQLVSPADVGALAEALDAVVGDPAWRRRAQAAAEQTRRRFSWPEDELRAIYLGPSKR